MAWNSPVLNLYCAKFASDILISYTWFWAIKIRIKIPPINEVMCSHVKFYSAC